MIAELEVGEHAQLLDGACRQVLRFVDDQKAALAMARVREKKSFERRQQFGLRASRGLESECRGNHAQRVLRIQLRREKLTGDDVCLLEAVEQAAQDRRLASANLAGDDDEAFIAGDAVFEVGLRALVLLARVVEVRVGIELERM